MAVGSILRQLLGVRYVERFSRYRHVSHQRAIAQGHGKLHQRSLGLGIGLRHFKSDGWHAAVAIDQVNAPRIADRCFAHAMEGKVKKLLQRVGMTECRSDCSE